MIEAVEKLYNWIDQQVENTGDCKACGDCCDFEKFDHRLYVTSVELAYFTEKMKHDLRKMDTTVCPYRVEGKCTVYPYRFAGCRIFACGRNADTESSLSEETLGKLKQIGEEYEIPYRYTDLKTALNSVCSV
jgi:Fe-S-cluster containining protein